MRRGALLVAVAAAAVLAGGWALTLPRPLGEGALPADWTPADADAANGARLFALGGCIGCHAAPDAEGETRRVLSGGRRFETGFGTFLAPNVSPHPEAGIGGWSARDFASAMLRGVSPDGAHYYPAFPWTSYSRMSVDDVLDLWAHLRTLPADPTPSAPHEIGFPWNLRAGIGLWKALNLHPEPVISGLSGAAERGRVLSEGVGHCAECHTPRGPLGGAELDRWMAGGPNPDGPGKIPNVTPAALTWSASDIAYYLETGFTPDFDSVGGSMVEVVRGTSQLTPGDREAIAAYLKALPPVE